MWWSGVQLALFRFLLVPLLLLLGCSYHTTSPPFCRCWRVMQPLSAKSAKGLVCWCLSDVSMWERPCWGLPSISGVSIVHSFSVVHESEPLTILKYYITMRKEVNKLSCMFLCESTGLGGRGYSCSIWFELATLSVKVRVIGRLSWPLLCVCMCMGVALAGLIELQFSQLTW